MLHQLQYKIKSSAKILHQHKGNLIFIGPSGCGKTTLLMKIVMSYMKISEDPRIACISVDPQLKNQVGLSHFCHLLGIPCLFLESQEHLETALAWNTRYSLILVDSPAKWPFEQKWAQKYLERCSQPEVIVCLSSTIMSSVYEQHFASHRGLYPRLAVLTKQDEAHSLGESLSLAIEHDLSLNGLSYGINLSEGFSQMSSHELVDLAKRMFEKKEEVQKISF